ncbi:MAG: hypothetical protein V3V08_05025 [Nannocystaceae bacterium]
MGVIPARTLVDVGFGVQTVLSPGQKIAFGIGVQNLTDTPQFSRTDDRNAGILPLRPRTLFVNLSLIHSAAPK